MYQRRSRTPSLGSILFEGVDHDPVNSADEDSYKEMLVGEYSDRVQGIQGTRPAGDELDHVRGMSIEELEQALEDLTNDHVHALHEKYVGFKKLSAQLKRKGVKDPDALAASIGRKKYGKAKFQKAAAKGKSLKNTNS